MKILKAGDAAYGFTFDKPRTVETGKTYDHLEVIEELPRRPGARRWRCRCVNVVDGEPCGRVVVKETGALTKDAKFRACPRCTEVYMKVVRERWNKGGSY